MINKILDWVFPIGGAAGASLGAYIFDAQHHVIIAIDAFIIALVGGITGWLVKRGADWALDEWKCYKKKRKKEIKNSNGF